MSPRDMAVQCGALHTCPWGGGLCETWWRVTSAIGPSTAFRGPPPHALRAQGGLGNNPPLAHYRLTLRIDSTLSEQPRIAGSRTLCQARPMRWRLPSVAIMIGILCLFFGAIAALKRIPEQPAHQARARITGLLVEATRSRGLYTTVTFSTDDGRTGTTTMPSQLVTCRIGDVVPAKKVGINLFLTGNACEAPWGDRRSAPA
jgi:hypothetical protein